MIRPSQSVIVVIVSRWISRLIQIFALYVVFHGHYSPGGGFQGGALLAASVLLIRLSEGGEASQREFRDSWGLPFSGIGALVFLGIGLMAFTNDGRFLDYEALPIPGMEGAALRSFGILLVEAGIALAVMAALIFIFDQLAGEEKNA